MGRIIQVNVSALGGVPKLPVPRATVRRLGLEGDGVAHPRYHGGPDRAVLLVANEWLDALAAEGYDVAPGHLGENLTTVGLEYADLPRGARLVAGTATLRVTKPRDPCRTLERWGTDIMQRIYNPRVHAGDTTDPLWGASGLLCAVETEGDVAPGDPIRRL